MLVKLGTLSQAAIELEILELEDISAAFRGSSDELRGVDFDEVVPQHELTVNLANSRLQSENSLICGYTQINYTVVKTHILLDDR